MRTTIFHAPRFVPTLIAITAVWTGAAVAQERTTQITESGFARTFGRVLHTAVMYGDGKTDLTARALEIADVAHDLTPSGGKFSLLKPLMPDSVGDSIVWVESYDDVVAWAQTERTAQRSPNWFAEIGAFFGVHKISMGLSQAMVEDTLEPKTALTDQPDSVGVAVQWIKFRAPLGVNLTRMPALAAELEALLTARGVTTAQVRYFGMPTNSGPDRTLGHLWIEYPDSQGPGGGAGGAGHGRWHARLVAEIQRTDREN